jgi:poly(hydroxyalkanoate) depolymerase family esterase
MRTWLKRLLSRPIESRPPVRTVMKLLAQQRTEGAWLAGVTPGAPIRGFFERLRHNELAYRLFLPTRRDAAERVPLLVMLHGCKQDAEIFAAGTRMNAVAEARGMAVLYPEQSRAANYRRCWNWFSADAIAGGGEAAAIVAAVEAIAGEYPIDATRIYVAGMSAGGAMAALLAARYGALFAACGIHSGLMFNAASGPIQALSVMRTGAVSASSPDDSAQALVRELAGAMVFVPTIVIHGSADETVNAVNFSQIVEQLCAVANKLSPGKQPLGPPRSVTRSAGGRSYLQQDYLCGDKVLVRSLAIEELGHAWSGGDAEYPYHDAAGPDASEIIADFVLHYRRDEPAVTALVDTASSADFSGAAGESSR